MTFERTSEQQQRQQTKKLFKSEERHHPAAARVPAEKEHNFFFLLLFSLSLLSAVHSLSSSLPSLTRLPFFFTHSLKKKSKRAGGFEDALRQKNLVRVKANRARAIENESINPIDFSNSWETVGRELLSIRVNHRSHSRTPVRFFCRCTRRKFTQPRGNSPPFLTRKKNKKESS